MFGGGNCPFSKNLDLRPMASLPPVESMQAGWNTFVNVYDQQGHLLIYSDPNFDGTLNAFDLDEPDSVRPLLLSGRYPRTADEVLMGWGESEVRRPVDGETIDVSIPRADAFGKIAGGDEPTEDDLLTVPLKVVGTAIMPGELDGTGGSLGVIPAFADRYRDEALGCDAGMFQLSGGPDGTAAFWTGSKQIAPGAFGFDTSTERTIAERATSLQSVMLRLFGGLAALAALLVLGQVLVRRTLLAATDAPVLRALGMSRGQLVRAALLPAVAVALLGTAIAIGGAVALSVLTPLGDARSSRRRRECSSTPASSSWAPWPSLWRCSPVSGSRRGEPPGTRARCWAPPSSPGVTAILGPPPRRRRWACPSRPWPGRGWRWSPGTDGARRPSAARSSASPSR